MKHLASIAVLCLLAGLANADTFELSDPANEMYEEEKTRKEQQAQDEVPTMKLPAGNVLCTVDTSSGSCSCIDKELARKLPLSQQECVAEVLRALNR